MPENVSVIAFSKNDWRIIGWFRFKKPILNSSSTRVWYPIGISLHLFVVNFIKTLKLYDDFISAREYQSTPKKIRLQKVQRRRQKYDFFVIFNKKNHKNPC